MTMYSPEIDNKQWIHFLGACTPTDLRPAPTDLREAPTDLREAPTDLREAPTDLLDAPAAGLLVVAPVDALDAIALSFVEMLVFFLLVLLS